MATGIVIGRILLTTDHLFGMKHASVFSLTLLVNNSRLQIDKNGAWNVSTRASFVEESRKRIVFFYFTFIRLFFEIESKNPNLIRIDQLIYPISRGVSKLTEPLN